MHNLIHVIGHTVESKLKKNKLPFAWLVPHFDRLNDDSARDSQCPCALSKTQWNITSTWRELRQRESFHHVPLWGSLSAIRIRAFSMGSSNLYQYGKLVLNAAPSFQLPPLSCCRQTDIPHTLTHTHSTHFIMTRGEFRHVCHTDKWVHIQTDCRHPA